MPQGITKKRSFLKVGILILICTQLFFGCQKMNENEDEKEPVYSPAPTVQEVEIVVELVEEGTDEPIVATAIPTPEPTATPIPTERPRPHSVAASDPKNVGYFSELEVNGARAEQYERSEPISFGAGKEYAAIEGVVTLRGNNHRTNAAYGTVPSLSGDMEKVWSISTGRLEKSSSGHWSGSGWTGQCLIVRWDEQTRRIMNLYDWAKEKTELVEVIYATMDGCVYFIELETGEPTRDKLEVGIPFKGAGALDPRGYPILYLGTGDSYRSAQKKGRSMAYSLIDFTRLMEIGVDRDDFAYRNWHAYDSSPLVDAETDTLIVPGENGILYTVKMNTQYDPQAGTLTMQPGELVKQRYDAERVDVDRNGKYLYGYESSAVAWGEYLYLCDNGGFMRCIDSNTMETLWVTDLKDDINSTPALEETADGAYLYVGNTVDKTARGNRGISSFYKISAMTGEIVWQYDHEVTTDSHITGGCMCSAVLGEGSMEGLVITGFASTGGGSGGEIVALDTQTGEKVWSFTLSAYTWSSPLALYTEDGTGYLFTNDRNGNLYLLNGADGTKRTSFKLSENIEASPCAFGEFIVIGTRDQHIIGIRVS